MVVNFREVTQYAYYLFSSRENALVGLSPSKDDTPSCLPWVEDGWRLLTNQTEITDLQSRYNASAGAVADGGFSERTTFSVFAMTQELATTLADKVKTTLEQAYTRPDQYLLLLGGAGTMITLLVLHHFVKKFWHNKVAGAEKSKALEGSVHAPLLDGRPRESGGASSGDGSYGGTGTYDRTKSLSHDPEAGNSAGEDDEKVAVVTIGVDGAAVAALEAEDSKEEEMKHIKHLLNYHTDKRLNVSLVVYAFVVMAVLDSLGKASRDTSSMRHGVCPEMHASYTASGLLFVASEILTCVALPALEYYYAFNAKHFVSEKQSLTQLDNDRWVRKALDSAAILGMLGVVVMQQVEQPKNLVMGGTMALAVYCSVQVLELVDYGVRHALVARRRGISVDESGDASANRAPELA